MSIRLQPEDIDIPKDNPFLNDQLQRQGSIEALTNVLGNLEGPCVIAVDAGWGMGKTTFLRMWAQHLRNKQFPVVEFNAWETDFTWDPFSALWSELAAQLGEQPNRDSYTLLSDLARKLSPVLRVGSVGTGIASGALEQSELAMAATSASEIMHHMANASDSNTEEDNDQTPFLEAPYRQAKELLENFQTSLQENAQSLAEHNGGRPLVVFIDELDRCRPTYAIELLETAKHLFSVDRIVFVLCLDREQLAHSVKAVYGSDFAANGYLRRFFDIDYRLPHPDRKAFVTSGLAATGVPSFLKHPSRNQENSETTLKLIHEILSSRQFSLRDTLQLIHRLGVVLYSTPIETSGIHIHTLTILLLLRFVAPTTYESLLQGMAKDIDAIRALFSHPETHAFRDSEDGRIAMSILIASVILSTKNDGVRVTMRDYEAYASYDDLANTETTAGTPSQDRDDIVRAKRIVQDVDRYTNRDRGWPDDPPIIADRCGYRQAVRQLELFPAELSE